MSTRPTEEEAVPRVLICTPQDLQDKLRTTLLWRAAIDRLADADGDVVIGSIRDRRPRLVIVDGREPGAVALVRQIRTDAETRDVSVAALLDEVSDGREADLREAGANVVLSSGLNLALWDDAFQELLNVPPRRWTSFPVGVTVGARPIPDGERLPMTALNISIRGLLVETAKPLPTGTVVNLYFDLADPPEVHLAGRIVWERPAEGGLSRQGVEFLGFHGDALGRIASFVGGGSPGESDPE
jgi:CheY-like chemotaxis protein